MDSAKVLIIAEHDQVNLSIATRKAITAAHSLKQYSDNVTISVLVAGFGCANVTEQVAYLDGVEQVLVADDACYQYLLAENIAKLVADITSQYTHLFISSSTQGKDLLPRIAAKLNVEQLSDVMGFTSLHSVVRPIYAGNALAEVSSSDPYIVSTIRAASFDACNSSDSRAEIVHLDKAFESSSTRFVELQVSKSERPELANANVVVAGGRGVASKEGFVLIEQLADVLGGAVGASRAAVDADYISNDHQVGQTGKIISPDLYIAAGISGAIQHIAGIKDAKVIVAINKDPDATIFHHADYGLVGDLFELIPEFIQKYE
ncbi:electron transfer flavoprotein subunit alpha/FixB family protein [Photobacterium leiognathi]|uniref:electron transfer flavoprotein subunit alpha/FixB family protein n=1 Tax=Photobacterium leiognathi TaxID=553611 RepID=UPI002980C7D7|nr:FAD-binding protein [Photobacterium leiognathi]